jgi:hypothetical protein
VSLLILDDWNQKTAREVPDDVDITILYRQIQIARRLLLDRFEMAKIHGAISKDSKISPSAG